jgi:hypothetical protein
MKKLKSLGEPTYMAEKQREAGELIGRRPLRFVGLTLRRTLYTWTGLWDFPPRWSLDDSGLPDVLVYSFVSLLAFAGFCWAIHDRRDGVIPLAIVLIFFPLAYYLTHSDIRFRHPIDPVVVVFMAYGAIAFRGRKLRLSERLSNVSYSGRIS